jgi:uncharacterized protein
MSTALIEGPAQVAPSSAPTRGGAIREPVVRHPVVAYYLLTFAISWGGILFVLGGPGRIPGSASDLQRLMPLAIPFMLFGPTIAALAMTGFLDGRAGYRQFRSHLFTWRLDARWYAFALFTAPIVYALVLLILSQISSVFLPGIITTPDKFSFVLVGTAPGFLVGFMEELGWTGFATPRLRLRHGILKTGLGIGVVWGAWHLLTNVLWPATVLAHGIPLASYVALSSISILIGQLPAFRVLMVWLYDRTQSLLLVMLMHASLVFSTFVLGPIDIDGIAILIYGFAVGVGMWLVVGIVNISTGGALIGRRL